MITSRCAWNSVPSPVPDVSGCPAYGALSKAPPANHPVPAAESIMNGENIREANRVLKNSTGRTALSFSADFLEVSYSPRRAADTNASASHIVQLFLVFAAAAVPVSVAFMALVMTMAFVSFAMSSVGPVIRVSGVRNSCENLVKRSSFI